MAGSADERTWKILKTLLRGVEQRFRCLMDQCEELCNITRHYRSAQAGDETDADLAELRLDVQDRLLWLFLQMLYTEHVRNRFFDTTAIDRIEREIHQVEKWLERERDRLQTPQRQRIAATLWDNLEDVP